ncbi:uncharacterized protein LOC113766438 [Coffea eugenioides]|uniref:uncharacterized protein LOC113766438 n=1 Tax=Coffea eugenioides TaxID=49369 RepID=UPI000F611AE6|nr:uncharacterized protein LOC113766438 [Coffea eugenioides]
MSYSKLSVRDDPDKLREKREDRNRKKREKFAALSVEEKEAQRKKSREAYHRKKLEKIVSKSLPQQFEEACKSPASASVIRSLPTQQSSHGFNDKLNRPIASQISKHNNNVHGIIGCNQGASKAGIRISPSSNNNTQLSCAELGKKLKQQISSFSTYEKGSTSNCATQHTCVPTDMIQNADKSFICMNCYKFLTEIAEETSDLSAILPTYQVYEVPHNRSARRRRNAGRSHPSAKQVKAVNNKKKKNRGNQPIDGVHALQFITGQADRLPSKADCQYCGAKKLYSETPNFCCSDGQVVLHENKLPDILVELFTGHSDEALSFRTYVRTYNNMFAFTSFGVHYDKSLCKRTNGIYTFKVQGQTYHFIKDLIPHGGSGLYLQLYFHDTDHELENRMAVSERLTETIVMKIMEVMKSNPYACFLRSLRNVPNLDSYQIVLKSHSQNDQRVFNHPTASQVAALWTETESSGASYGRHIQIYTKEGRDHLVQYYYGCYDPLQYPLLFALGETGWHSGIRRFVRENPKKRKRCIQRNKSTALLTNYKSVEDIISAEQQVSNDAENNGEFVSMREYYAYKLQMRDKYCPNILNTGRLLQQYVVDMYIKIESQRLDYYKSKQEFIRREQLQGVMDSVITGQCQASKIGQRVVLPASFIGGPRDMKRRYVDAMALVQKFGKPDLFITMTCNPSWPEVKNLMLPTDEAHNRPDLLSRIFHAKLDVLKQELFKKEIFGSVAAYTYVIEFQKRGLPHAHFLIILKPSSKLYSTDSYDKIVSAEIPDQSKNPHLFNMVRRHMIHGPCGKRNPTNVCMQGEHQRKCRNNYPKPFADKTFHGDNAYPTYQRRNNGYKMMVRGHEVDNRWVVPYSPYLLAKFNCHLNVEICSTVKAVKYIYKYIYKGHDKIHFQLSSQNSDGPNSDAYVSAIDEIKDYQSARWVCAVEGIWRIYRFLLFQIHPAVIHLQLHLENCQPLNFREDQDLRDVVRNRFAKRTMLTEFFYTNSVDPLAQNLKCTYKHFPEHFVWYPGRRKWEPRKQKDCIGRIVAANPMEGERYFLRLLLTHVESPTSFDHLKTINGVYVHTFREAAILRGYFESDKPQQQCLEEVTVYHMPYSLRRLFATLLVHFPPSNPRYLWEQFQEPLSEDISRTPQISVDQIRFQVLYQINEFLQSMGKDINQYALVPNTMNFDNLNKNTHDMIAETRISVPEHDLLAIEQLNADQKKVFDIIMHAAFVEKKGAFFIDGPGGTGKTFLYRALLAEIRSKGYIALATASCGVAASILPGGRTAHSRFKIPIGGTQDKQCRISKQSSLAKLLQSAILIIWDEAPMTHKTSIESVDRILRDIMDCNDLFGSKVIVFGGDFRQVLPVVTKGSKSEFIDASIVNSYIWPQLHKLHLTQNMRARYDAEFTEYLLRIGNGTEPLISKNSIQIPVSMLIRYTNEEESMNTLIRTVFPDLNAFSKDNFSAINRAILTTKNDFVDQINQRLILQFEGQLQEYTSRDKCIDTSEQTIMEDLLNSLTPNGFPPHKLLLKPYCPIMLLRNIDPPQGLCNGTRLICKSLSSNIMHAVITCGEFAGKEVFIHRICFRAENNSDSPVSFERIQFPVRPCFAMTINKAQGQTLDFVGIYLREPAFSHGQLYVAMSRAKNSSSIKILIKPSIFDDQDDSITENIVYTEEEKNMLSFPEIIPGLQNWTTMVQVLDKQKPLLSKAGNRYQKLILIDQQMEEHQSEGHPVTGNKEELEQPTNVDVTTTKSPRKGEKTVKRKSIAQPKGRQTADPLRKQQDAEKNIEEQQTDEPSTRKSPRIRSDVQGTAPTTQHSGKRKHPENE